MTTTSATSTIVSALGGGSGIDMAALATSLAEAQFAARIDRNSARADTVERQISASSTLKSQIQTLAASVGDRVRTGDISSQPAIANGAVAAVSRGVASGSGNYTLEVTALAGAQTLTSPAYAAGSAPVGSGSLTLRFGTITGSSFTEDSGHAPTTVTIASGATLADVAAAINAANAGVSAYVASGADGAHLMLKGAEGAANAFVLEASETVGEEGLAALAWNPAGDPARRLANAGDAAFKFDGLAMTSASNTIAEIVPGLNLKLTGTNPGSPTRISFSDPGAAATAFMQDLTSALNELAAELGRDADPQGGDLARDSGARAMRRALAALAGTLVMPGAAAGQPATLADLGLSTERDGTFRLDTTRLAATLKSSPAGVAAMFTTGLFGVYGTLDKLARTLTAASDPGSLGGSVSRYTALKTRLAEEKADLADAQEKLRAQLVTRFAGVDRRVSASQSTLSFLKAQIDAWNASKN
ncbi:MAG: flagellar filament capping protein FliD [Novosphingobium sp.]|uniref:flagellar filament capping protein FliD n=1 Tax=Novosphingobium sp. TaxID=1874826 RepID=UPI001D40CBF1|nr:flagellar filament capping protein FliD [Novosphingobium sp.]MCB2058682.1 flagellar filament capping protein FliD [Novosphingobium sp.]MCP5385657.1 flagellar filament capping protein FliD [Novosphingobium sp.]